MVTQNSAGFGTHASFQPEELSIKPVKFYIINSTKRVTLKIAGMQGACIPKYTTYSLPSTRILRNMWNGRELILL